MRRIRHVALLLSATTGCGSDTTQVNAPPNFGVFPVERIGQGQTAFFDLQVDDPDSDELTLSVSSADPDLEVEITVNIEELIPYVEIHAGYVVSGPVVITLTAEDARGERSMASPTVEVEPLVWHATQSWDEPAGPEAREHGAVVVDEQGSRVLLLGGSGYAPYLEPLADAWSYDLASSAWSPLTPSGDIPPGGGSRRAAQGLVGSTTAYLFGGYGANGTAHNELYAVDMAGGGSRVALVPQQNPPPARALHAFFGDASGRFYVFGGVGTAPLDDLWTMVLDNGTAVWTRIDVTPRPSPRYGFFYGWDAALHRLLVFSGAQGTFAVDPARDTWALDVSTATPSWQLLFEGDTAPPGRRNGCAVFDQGALGPAFAARLFVFGGTADAMTTEPGLWVLDARPGKERWIELALAGEPPVRSSGFGFYDAAGERMFFGFGNTATDIYRDWTALGY